MEVRFFFKDGTHQDIHIETYYKGEGNKITVVPLNGESYTLDEVESMIKIKDW